jgi:hypothetical protein
MTEDISQTMGSEASPSAPIRNIQTDFQTLRGSAVPTALVQSLQTCPTWVGKMQARFAPTSPRSLGARWPSFNESLYNGNYGTKYQESCQTERTPEAEGFVQLLPEPEQRKIMNRARRIAGIETVETGQ